MNNRELYEAHSVAFALAVRSKTREDWEPILKRWREEAEADRKREEAEREKLVRDYGRAAIEEAEARGENFLPY